MIPTARAIRRAWQSQDQRRLKAARVITAMQRGATMNLTFAKRGSVFSLSNGVDVAPEIAVMVINDLRIVSQQDGLFPSLSPQTWIYLEPPSS